MLTWVKTKPFHVDLAFRTMFATSIRISECEGLAPNDVQVDGHTLSYSLAQGKTGKDCAHRLLAAFARKWHGSANLLGIALFTVEWHARRLANRD